MKRNLFVDLLYLALRNRFFIIVNVAVITLAALVISLLLPKWYESSASIKLSSQETGEVKYALVLVPTDVLPRFLVLPEKNGKKFVTPYL